jgi:hypothetical protein
MKFQTFVRCGRRDVRKEFRVGPQMACWQNARLNASDSAASLSMLGVCMNFSPMYETSGLRSLHSRSIARQPRHSAVQAEYVCCLKM